MCVNYLPVSHHALENNFNAAVQGELDWKAETWQDYPAPIIIGQEGRRKAVVGLYSMIPKAHIPPGVKRFSTMNARGDGRHFAQLRQALARGTTMFVPNVPVRLRCMDITGKPYENWSFRQTANVHG